MNLTYIEIRDTFAALGKTADYLDTILGGIETFLKKQRRFVFLGCGSSYSLAKSMAVMTQMGTGLPAAAMAAGDVLLHAGRYAKCFDGAAVVCVSRSGRTSELIMALEALKSCGYSFEVASHVCADGTPLASLSDLTVSTPWAFDNSVCQTRSVTNFYFAAAYILAKATGDNALLEDLRHVIGNGPEYMHRAEALADKLAERPWTHCVVLADAELEGIAEEGALAFKEICQLSSNYYHVLDVRHGPMVLLGERTLVLAALGAKNAMENMLLQDIKKKGAEIVAFSDMPAELGDIPAVAYGRQLSHAARGIPFIILCQMTAYKKAQKTGADPDKPTGLEPWISL